MTPQLVSLTLFGVIILAAVVAVLWGMRGAAARKKDEKLPGGKPSRGIKPASARVAVPAAARSRPPARAKLTDKELSALERKWTQARRKFVKTIDKRILREPMIQDRLRATRDVVLTWYEQKGKVESLRYQAGDSRSACKVCQGRHGKEYRLLETDVIARILPPSHSDDNGRRACSCTVHPVIAGDR